MESALRTKIASIARHYGYQMQSRQLMEEMSELSVVLNKYYRASLKDKSLSEEWKNIVEEIADVTVVLEQIKILLGIHDSKVEATMESKIERQLKIIKEETM